MLFIKQMVVGKELNRKVVSTVIGESWWWLWWGGRRDRKEWVHMRQILLIVLMRLTDGREDKMKRGIKTVGLGKWWWGSLWKRPFRSCINIVFFWPFLWIELYPLKRYAELIIPVSVCIFIWKLDFLQVQLSWGHTELEWS